MGPLDVSRLKPGARVLAQVTEDWKTTDCHLRLGALIQGNVVQVVRRSKAEKTSSMQLAFNLADCNNHPATAYPFTLIAVIGPFGDPAPNGESGMSEAPPLADAPGLMIGASSGGSSQIAPSGMRSIEAASTITDYTMQAGRTRTLPSHILLGQVIDSPHIDLAVAAGLNGATVVSAYKTDARLERRTTMILLPSSSFIVKDRMTAEANRHQPASSPSATTAAPSSTPGVPSAAALTPPPPPDIDETDICSGSCNILGPLTSRAGSSSAVVASLSIDKLGYSPHDKERSLFFDHNTTLTYLDEHHLLCTFDPHRLRIRAKDDADSIRSIRAVLVDTSTHTITHLMDWRVRGSDGYLWRLGSGQVLVHLGHELRLFDAELKPIKSIPVEGAVAWVVSSPSNDHIAIAVVHKRYSANEYVAFQALSLTPDEDLEVRVYDQNLHLLSASIRSAQTFPPVLSDAGELRVDHVSRAHWKLVEYGWDKSLHTLASVKSACRPQLSAPARGLTFVVGCMYTTGAPWYRMLRSDGHPLLKAESSSDELAQSAQAALAGSFAVRLLKAVRPMNVNQPFNRSDLTLEEIAIYRTSDGARLSSVVTNDFILAQDSYALSPGGDQMALAGQNSILFYSVKAH
jgi:hypothetical protein